MTGAILRRKKEVLSAKRKVLKVFINTTEGTTLEKIVKQLSIDPLCIKGLLATLRKSNIVFYNDGVWSAKEKSTIVRKQEPPYPDFDKEHEKWLIQVFAKKQFNPDGN